MKKKAFFYAVLLAGGLLLSSCQGKTTEKSNPDDAITETAKESIEPASEPTINPTVEISDEGLTPVTADMLKDGTYEIEVESSSTMFKINACTLTVQEGEMTADMEMSGTGYLYLFLGKGDDATEDDYIYFTEDADGKHHYVVPVEALNRAVDCAAFSKAREQWYDRTLIFRADKLPLEAYADGLLKTAQELSLEDGSYTAEVTLSGGSGKAYVESPAALTVKDGEITATIIFSSPNYDYMVVDGARYEPVNTEGNSTFVIPVAAFDTNLQVSADTTAMSTPHEIAYTLYFDADTLKAQ